MKITSDLQQNNDRISNNILSNIHDKLIQVSSTLSSLSTSQKIQFDHHDEKLKELKKDINDIKKKLEYEKQKGIIEIIPLLTKNWWKIVFIALILIFPLKLHYLYHFFNY